MRHHPSLVLAFSLITVAGLALPPGALAGERAALVAAGEFHTCAATTSGPVLCWGRNADGQLGDGTTTQRLTPVSVVGFPGPAQGIAAGGGDDGTATHAHTCAITLTGGVMCWGANSHGQLGNNSTVSSSTPVQVSGLTSGVSAIATGGTHSCALTDAGSIWCWGWNASGQLGNNSTTDSLVPVQVTGLTSGATRVTAGHSHTCAVVSGAAKCWGAGGNGQLGWGSQSGSNVPIQVTGLNSGVASIAAGWRFTCAVIAGGAAKCWGHNQNGQLGIGTTSPYELSPVQVNGLTTGVVSVAGGRYHTCAQLSTGAAYCWGLNGDGQVGDGTNIGRPEPWPSELTAGTIRLAAGSRHTCAVTASGAARCWGYNLYGQVGINSADSQYQPVAAWTLGGWPSMDANADGRSDFFWRHAVQGDVWLWLMNGASKMAELYINTVADPNWQIRALADFDSDGKTDILWRHATTGMIYLWTLGRDPALIETYVSTVDTAYDIVSVADYEGHGKATIVWRHATTGELWGWVMEGATKVEESYIATVDPAFRFAGSGDLNGDGLADVVWRHATSGEVWVWVVGESITAGWVGTVEDLGFEIVGVTDYTGDSKADLLWRHATSGEVWLWAMDGLSKVSESYVGTVPDTGYRIVGSGDYDLDGKADILWHHNTRGEVWVWFMEGPVKRSEARVGSVPDVLYQIVKVP
jgi:alpha-tubulin suppressor-like RCC1 family protein